MTAPPASRPWLPYVAPMATFLLLTTAEGWLPKPSEGSRTTFYPAFYAVKISIVALVCWLCRSTWRDLKPWPGAKSLGLATVSGLFVAAIWVGLDGRYPIFGDVGSRASFDPDVLTTNDKLAFLAFRMLGLVLIVPFFEELFWRSFVVRYVIDPDHFEDVPIGRVTWAAAGITAALFALEHPAEWLPALITGALWAGLLHQTKSVSACFVSHAVANLGLGVYVLKTGAYKFW